MEGGLTVRVALIPGVVGCRTEEETAACAITWGDIGDGLSDEWFGCGSFEGTLLSTHRGCQRQSCACVCSIGRPGSVGSGAQGRHERYWVEAESDRDNDSAPIDVVH